jgi:hypothetical protein
MPSAPRRPALFIRGLAGAIALGALSLVIAGASPTPASLAPQGPASLHGDGVVAFAASAEHHDAAAAVASSGTGRQQYWQVGLAATAQSSYATAMRTAIVTRLPQRVASATINYFWIGSYLADGSFVQVGYYVSSTDRQRAGWFYCAFTPSGRQGPCVYGAPGSAGHNGETHTYALEAGQPSGSAPGDTGPATWFARFDDRPVGSFHWTSGTTGVNSPSIYAESSGLSMHVPGQLGPVDFVLPVQTHAAGQPAYVTAGQLHPVYGSSDSCPPYGIAADATQGVLVGSGLPCPSVGVHYG